MALLEILLPGMGGSTGALVSDSISLLENLATCGPEDPLSCFTAVVDLVFVAYDIYQTFFPSRPKVGKDSASDDTALFFIPSSNPVIALWGIGIRDLEAQGIPTSVSGGPGLTAQYNLANAVLADLKKQFDGPGAPKLNIDGVPATGQQVFDWYHLLGLETANPDSDAAAIAQRAKIDALYTSLVESGWVDPETGFPKPTSKPPPGKCPVGQYWDGTKCVPLPTTGIPTCAPGYYWTGSQCAPRPPSGTPTCNAGYEWNGTACVPIPPPPPPTQQPDPEQDEFQDCCDETQANLQTLINLVGGLKVGQQPAPDNSACCAQITQVLGSVAQNLFRIASSLAAKGPTEIYLEPVVLALDNVSAAVKAAQTQMVGLDDGRNAQLAHIASAIASAPKTDVSGIVKALNEIVAQGDVKQSVLDYLTRNGFMSGADAQVISGAPWSDAIVGVFRTWGWNALVWALSTVGITYNGSKFVMGSLSAAITADIDNAVTDALNVGSAPLYPVVKGLVDAVVATLNPAGAPALGNSGVDTDVLLSKTLAPALIVNAVMLLAGYFGWDISEQLREYVDLVAEFTGLVEVKEIALGTRMQAGPIAAARLQAQNLYRQSLPGAGQVANWHARGLSDNAHVRHWLGLGGWQNDIQDVTLLAAQTGINPRQLLRLIPTGLFTDADLQDEMTFAGMRDSSQHRMLLAAPYLATEPYRSQLRSAIEAAAAQGLLSDVDVTTQIDSAEHNTDRDSLIISRIHLQEQTALTKALETEYTTAYVAGMTTQPAYESNIRGLPIQPWKQDAIIGVAEARRNATVFKQETAAERALERATAAKERAAAMKGFSSGNLDPVALVASLVATGLTTTQAAAWTTLAQFSKDGNLRWIYGLQMAPAQATLLKQRVTAITDQRKKSLITDAQYVAQLQALKLPDHWINALRAAADATLTPKAAQSVIPVQTH